MWPKYESEAFILPAEFSLVWYVVWCLFYVMM